MRTIYFLRLFISVILLLLVSCTKEEEIKTSESDSPKVEVVDVSTGLKATSTVSSGTTVLNFKGTNDLNNVKQAPDNLSVLVPVDQIGRFESMRTIYNRAMEEAESYYDRPGGYEEFKAKYPMLYYPEVGNDFGAYLPLADESYADIVNANCEYMLANTLMKAPRITYRELANERKAYIEDEENHNAGILWDNIDYTPDNRRKIYTIRIDPIDPWNYIRIPVGTEHQTGWMDVGDKRKMRVTLRKITRNTYMIGFLPNGFKLEWHVEVSFRKKAFFGAWYNYSSKTSCQATIMLLDPTFTNDYMYDSKSGNSSHDYYFKASCEHIDRKLDGPYSMSNATAYNPETNNAYRFPNQWLYRMPGYMAHLKISFRGMTADHMTFNFSGKECFGDAAQYSDKLKN